MPFLEWVNKAQAQRIVVDVPYHLLQFQSAHGDASAENLLIQGDNLLALKAMLPFYRGRVKCVFIDPPYNTQTDFGHYDDKLEHSTWLSMMQPRLVLLRDMLTEDGSIWITIDDNEAHYLKVLMDELFLRDCFIADIAWKRRDGAPNDRKIGSTYDHVLVYARSKGGSAKKTRAEEAFNLMQRTEKADSQYRLYEEPFGFDERGPFRKVDSTGNAKGGRFVESLIYPVKNPFTGEDVFPRKGRCWVYKKDDMLRMVEERRFFWGKDGKAGTPMRKLFVTEAKAGMTAPTVWDDVGLNQHAAREIELLFGEKAAFETPKPENLMKRILEIATNPDDLVLDSFLGSGTTAAVAHKMGRRYIGIEMGEHAVTHCLPRLQKVIDGEQGGISQAANWQGGGGFRFHTLGEPVFDADGGIHPAVRFAALAAYLWHFETGDSARQVFDSPLLGVQVGTAYFLLYNGILGDRRPAGGNVLTSNVLAHLDALFPHAGPRVIYGETTRLGEARLREAGVVFKQIPYDIKAR
jgi:adenine-specific DNA-methyltransferase